MNASLVRWACGGALCLAALGRPVPQAPAAEKPRGPFVIEVVDSETGRGVPLVELSTVHHVAFWTDSQGLAAVDEPELMSRKVFFSVRSHGYEYPKDGFGFAGTALDVRPGGRATLKLKRMNIAQRLYRITGAGIYRDSVLAGAAVPVRQPVLNAEVTGQDSAMAVPFDGNVYWFWGDTSRLRHPLGLFHTSGATAGPAERIDPERGIELAYFADASGFSRAMAPGTPGELTWIDGLSVVPDATGRLRMAAHYSRRKSLEVMIEHGLLVWDETQAKFTRHAVFPKQREWSAPRGHPVPWTSEGKSYLLSAQLFSMVRVPASLAALAEPERYEAFTCLPQGGRFRGKETKVERNAAGEPVWDWKRDTEPIGAEEERALIAAGEIRADEARYQPRDAEGGKPIRVHHGSMAWNAYRKRWIVIATEIGGRSPLGEVWFCESPSPLGPWRQARRIVTHQRYSFYNPVHHPFLDRDGGRLIYFEGTYTHTFSGNPVPTPRYDYNQVMYRLDLADPRLGKPAE